MAEQVFWQAMRMGTIWARPRYTPGTVDILVYRTERSVAAGLRRRATAVRLPRPLGGDARCQRLAGSCDVQLARNYS